MTTTPFHPAKRNPKEITQSNQSSQNDLYTRITGKIIADLEAGNLTWRKP